MITLQPITLVKSTEDNIYALSRIHPPQTITASEFMRLADYPRLVYVSLAADGESDPQSMTAYNFGLHRWGVVVEAP